MTHQLTIFGEEHYAGSGTDLARKIVEKFPVCLQDGKRYLLYYYSLKECVPWFNQMPEERQNEVKHVFEKMERIRRAAQDIKSSKPT